MQLGKPRSTIGCLMINELTSEERQLSGLSVFLGKKGIYSRHFNIGEDRRIHAQLQSAYQKVCANSKERCIIGAGTGSIGALALAAQLPVDRLILMDEAFFYKEEETGKQKQFKRLAGFANRNISFCVTNALLIADNNEDSLARMLKMAKAMSNSSVCLIQIWGALRKDLCTNCESAGKEIIYSFLSSGGLPKYLAEKSEMCIIY